MIFKKKKKEYYDPEKELLKEQLRKEKRKNEILQDELNYVKEIFDRDLLYYANKIDFKPITVEYYQPFRYLGQHYEIVDKGIVDGVQVLESVCIDDFQEEKRWHDVVTFEENPREYLDEIRLRYLRER